MSMDINIADPDIASLRPSCKLVYLVLDTHGPCSLSEVRSRTALPDSTARDALEDLQDQDLATRKHCPDDPREARYDIRAK